MSLPRPDDDKEFTLETRDAPPAHFLIKIESFSSLSECGIKKYETREFEAGDYKWKLIIYPDGHVSGSEGNHVSVYLAMAGTSSLPVNWEVNAIFSIFLFNKMLDNYLCFRGKVRRFHAMQSEWGFSKMISKKSFTDESNGFLVDDNCVFGAEVFVIKRQQQVVECVSVLKVPIPYKHDWKIENFSKLGNVWTSEEFTVGDHKWKIMLFPNGYIRKRHSYSGTSPPVASHSLKTSQWFTSSVSGLGWPAFIPIADMRKGFIVDDCCFLEIEISVRAVVRNAPSTSN